MKEAMLLTTMKEIKTELSESQEYYWISAVEHSDLICDLLGLYFSLQYHHLTFSNPNNDGEIKRIKKKLLYLFSSAIKIILITFYEG